MTRYDPLTKEERSERMSRVRSIDSKPELVVRCLVHSMGYRYRLHSGRLPGNPDLSFSSRRKVIFVHGCFWHQHGCRKYRMPRTRKDFWEPKLERNKVRDRKVRAELRAMGWQAMVIWECQTKNQDRLQHRLVAFLERSR
ncbi:very short patch repair endonuclease [Candidatus Nitrospira inopinata]|jgi:DNA mismatch endonuclease (patch repair protein)|uniref:very short patch repair endonuclease n=1 Tax=Candidatus Nitrospira inopinata TaxID=1715989 RepID=UPI0007847B67